MNLKTVMVDYKNKKRDGVEIARCYSLRVKIGIVFKYVSPFDTPAYNMMQGTWRIYSGLTWHVTSSSQTNQKETLNFNPVPLYVHRLPLNLSWRPASTPVLTPSLIFRHLINGSLTLIFLILT